MAPEPSLARIAGAAIAGPPKPEREGRTTPHGERGVTADDPDGRTAWTSSYLRARDLEGRLYPDAVVATLPSVPINDPHWDEWRLRQDSVDRLIAYLGRLPRPIVVLEVGCGNGWVANRVAALDGCRVIGLDANEAELAQARRVFGDRPNLVFTAGDATTSPPPAERPDVILLASVVQYVSDMPGLLRRLGSWLTPGGEIHIVDSPFYRPDEVPAARERTRRHYAALGVPEMAEVYHAHEWGSLEGFAVEVLYRPDAARVRFERRLLGRSRSPFPWIRIRGASGGSASAAS